MEVGGFIKFVIFYHRYGTVEDIGSNFLARYIKLGGRGVFRVLLQRG